MSLINFGVIDGVMLLFFESIVSYLFFGIRIFGLRGNDIFSEGVKYFVCVFFNDWC